MKIRHNKGNRVRTNKGFFGVTLVEFVRGRGTAVIPYLKKDFTISISKLLL